MMDAESSPTDPTDDTTPEAKAVLLDVYRRMSIADKWRLLGSMFTTARTLAAAGYRLRHPNATDEEVREAYLEVVLDPPLLKLIRESRHDQGE
jgi:hypothetical protein